MSDEVKNSFIDDNDVIESIPVTLTVELGKTKLTFKQLKQLNHGSVVELDKLAGENFEIKVNGKLIGNGEIVVVNEKYGIRFIDAASEDDRLKDKEIFNE